MSEIIGDYTGTSFDDFLVLPGLPKGNPEDVNLHTDMCGIPLNAPFFTAAMRSVTGKELALAAGKAGIMAVAPRGLDVKRQVEIVDFVKSREVKCGDIESETKSITIDSDNTLGDALRITREHGHSHVPVLSDRSDFRGMFNYKPSVHDTMDPRTPITTIMNQFEDMEGNRLIEVCYEAASDSEIKDVLEKGGYRFVPVLDEIGRLSRLVFLQREEAYKVGGAIDTHEGWLKRSHELVDAGVNMVFIDTSDAHTPFTREVVEKFKQEFDIPICAGNVVTPEAFEYLVDAGADVIKIGMGPGSICSTNQVLGIGSPPMHALIDIAKKRDEYATNGRYIPIIIDGGIRDTGNISVALTHADGLMGGKLFGGFEESAGRKIHVDGGKIEVEIFGEASRQSYETTGNMNRYTTDADSTATFQGVTGTIPYVGRFKPGVERLKRTLKEALYHAGCDSLKSYRDNARIVRLTQSAKGVAVPHDINVSD
ncbi:hypothetical protein CL614_07330 [archaeon]|nr:hypothetical protein [archaeon]|tara:strand:- start:138 stop:1583 length:1446 start_codon:yes stop_codon:yes gene_type:complete